MARNSKPGKDSDTTKQLQKEDEITAKKNAELQTKNEAEEAEKLATAKAESEDQTPPIAVAVPLPEKKRAEAWKKHVERYAEANPVKYAQKKARGEFDKIPYSFTGRNELNIQG